MKSKLVSRAFSALVLTASLLVSCNNDSAPEAGIVSFSFDAGKNAQLDRTYNASVSNGKIEFSGLPATTDKSVLVPSFSTKNADDVVTVGGRQLVSGSTVLDCSSDVVVVATNAEGKSTSYTLSVSNAPYPQPRLLSFSVQAQNNESALYEDETATITDDQVAIQFPSASDISSLVVSFTTNTGDIVRIGDASGDILESGVSAVDFTAPVTLFLTNGDGRLNAVYVVTASRKSMIFSAPVKVHTDSAGSTAMRINPVSGVPYIAYAIRGDKANAARTTLANVRKLDGGTWQSVGSADFGSGANDYMAIDFNKDGVPYIAYQSASKDPKDASVLKFNGSQWELVDDAGLHTSMDAATSTYTSLAVVGSNEVVVAQMNGSRNSSFARYAFVVSTFNGTSWTSAFDNANGSEPGYLCRAASNSDAACILYLTRNSPRKYGVSMYSNGAWSSLRSAYIPEGAANVYASLNAFDLLMTADGTIYTLTADDAENPGAAWKLKVDKYDPATSSWSVVGGGSIAYEMGTRTSVEDSRICVAPDGTVSVFYAENKSTAIKVVSVDPETLQWSAPATVLADGFKDKLNVAFAPNGVCYVVYRDADSRLWAIEGK